MRRGAMTKRNSSFDAHVFDNDDVFRLLKAAVKSEGGQTVFAKRHRLYIVVTAALKAACAH
jgi:hypothetical protein